MNFYKPDTIKKGVKISRYLSERGIKTQGNRAVAAWRDGSRLSVSFDDDKGVWHDFVAEDGGDIIALYIKCEGGDFLTACRTLGDRYHLTPDKVSRKPKAMTHGEILARDGFTLVKTYTYQNADGSPRYYVDRWEKIGADGKKIKEFDQRGPNGDGIKGIERTLYNLPAILTAGRLFVVEGEKDADTLSRLGLVATTNSGGAKYWASAFNPLFEGKDAIVIADNDEVGKAHADTVAASIAPFAKSVKVICPSKLPKGDATDFIEQEGGDLTALIEMAASAPLATTCKPEVAAAKIANEDPLRNYTEEETLDDEGKRKTRRVPRPIDDICGEMATRFLGYPKTLGTQLFDYTKDPNPRTGKREIMTLDDPDALRAWIDGVSRRQSQFQSGVGFVTYKSLAMRLMQTRPRYDVVAVAPWWPARDDAFCAFDPLPSPDPAHSKFDELVEFFNPETPADATLIKAFFMAPMANITQERPAWIIDTHDGQGSGKSKVAEKCCRLYAESPLRFDLETLKADVTKIKRELLSAEGRKKRIVLFDNVTTSFKNGNLATLITSEEMSGMRPFGHGVESRRNDLTFVATSNGATLDTDAAVRFYVIHVSKPAKQDPTWEQRLDAFIDENRAELWAEMADKMRNAKARARKASRFGYFDAVVLSAAADTDEEFTAADAKIAQAAADANDDADLGEQVTEAIADALTLYDASKGAIRGDLPCVIRATDVDAILRRTQGQIRNWTSKAVRRAVNNGTITAIRKGVDTIDTADGRRIFGRVRVFVYAANENVLHSATRGQFIRFDGLIPTVVGEGNIGC